MLVVVPTVLPWQQTVGRAAISWSIEREVGTWAVRSVVRSVSFVTAALLGDMVDWRCWCPCFCNALVVFQQVCSSRRVRNDWTYHTFGNINVYLEPIPPLGLEDVP